MIGTFFGGEAAYGYCADKNETYYGFKGHFLVDLNGTITGISLTAANVDEREAALDFADDIQGTLLGETKAISENNPSSKNRETRCAVQY